MWNIPNKSQPSSQITKSKTPTIQSELYEKKIKKGNLQPALSSPAPIFQILPSTRLLAKKRGHYHTAQV